MIQIETAPTRIARGPWTIKNFGPDRVYVGYSNVTTENGFPVDANETFTVGYSRSILYGMTEGTAQVDFFNEVAQAA